MRRSKQLVVSDKPPPPRVTFGPFDPRNPTKSLLTIVLVMLFLGWFIWILANWPASIGFILG
jgi:hypothetical protein